MEEERQNDVFAEFEKYTQFQRLIGMSSLIYSRGKIRVSRKWLIVNMVRVGVVLSANFFTIHSARKSLLYLSRLYYYLSTGNYFFVSWAISAFLIQCSRNVGLINRCLLKVRAVDLQLINLSGKLEDGNPRWAQILVFSLIFAALFIRFLLVETLSGYLYLIIVYIPFVLIITIQDNFDKIGSLLRQRFVAIKQHLISCLGMEAKTACPVLERLVLCYHYLSESSAHFDKYQSVQLISFLASTFISLFSEVFAMITILYKNEAVSNKYLTLTVKTFWIIVVITLFLRIGHLFQAITTEAKEFNTLLYEIMIGDKTNVILNNSKLKLHIAMNREVVFTAYGFFNLDYTLVHSIIASSTTYLVILLQFSDEPSSDLGGVTSANFRNVTTTPLPFSVTTLL